MSDTDDQFSEHRIVPAAERHQLLVEWNATEADYPKQACVHELFEAQAARSPESTAVVYEDQSLSYGELNTQANRLAHHLRGLGVRPDSRVAICVERSPEMVVGLMAILKAGGAYVPLDPAYPAERLGYMLQDSAPVLVLTHAAARGALSQAMAGLAEAPPVVDLDGTAWSQACPDNLDPAAIGLNSAHLAYVIYTSGSTGTPKGVMVEHRGVVNLVYALSPVWAYNLNCRIFLFSSFSFDAFVEQFTGALCNGGALCCPSGGGILAGASLRDEIVKLQPTHITLPPTVLQTINVEDDFQSLATIILAGEAAPRGLVNSWAARHRVFNAYGPTEATVCATMETCVIEALETAPTIGWPLSNVRVYILDEYKEQCKPGLIGEIYIGGPGVARGYLNREDINPSKFLLNPFVPGERLYATGDLGQVLSDGRIKFVGRVDFQLKVRGFRIEPGEIEAVISGCPNVQQVVVSPLPADKQTEDAIVAYIVPRNNTYLAELECDRTRLESDDWREVFQGVHAYGEQAGDFSGWNSSFSDSALSDGEMEEWYNEAFQKVAACGSAGVIDVGCGSGRLLHILAPTRPKYIGLDISENAIEGLSRKVRNLKLRPAVELICGDASAILNLNWDNIDTVVLNSVVQYFPSLLYLDNVISIAIEKLGPHGTIFIGDIRNRRLLEMFHLAVQLSKVGSDTALKDLKARARSATVREAELLIDPYFFSLLQERSPKIRQVQMLLKQSGGQNELGKYRYDVVIEVGDEYREVKPLQVFFYGGHC